MCGHVGIAGKLDYSSEETMRKLLVMDFFRGPDSTGIASFRQHTREFWLAKVASHPFDLFDNHRFKKTVTGLGASVLLGHNRAATIGKVNTTNAHPFVIDHICGAHNGTLAAASHRALNERLGEEFTSDSMAIFAHIAKFGIEETVPLLQGAWALVWIDEKKDTLNFIRNKERPLWYSWSEDFTQIFWGSEWEIIDAGTSIGDKGNVKMWKDGEKYSFFPFDVDHLYSLDIQGLFDGYDKAVDFKGKELKGKEPAPAVTYHSCGTTPFQYRKSGTTTGSLGSPFTTGTTTRRVVADKAPRLITLSSTKENPFGGRLSREEFNLISSSGCSFCGKDIHEDMKDLTIMETADSAVLCDDCSKEGGGVRIYAESH